MSKVQSVIDGQKDRFITLAVLATQLFNEQFYAGKPEDNWGKVTTDAAKRAEAQLNDPESFVGHDFIATIKALTGEEIHLRQPRTVSYRVGVCVVPVAPFYGERTDDGYALGKAYICTNETSGGKFRNADNIDEKGVRTASHGVRTGDSDRNQWKLMSTLHDEVRPANESEIASLLEGLLEVKGLSFLTSVLPDLEARYAYLLK